MAQPNPVEETFIAAAGLVSLAALLLVVILVSVYVLPVAIVLGGALLWWRSHRNSDVVRERESREHTEQLYRATRALAPKWPEKLDFGRAVYERLPKVSDPVADLMIEVALDLYDAEHFGDAVPSPPAICNSLEGQQYRDFLSGYAAKVRDSRAPKLAENAIVRVLERFLDRLPPPGNGRLSFNVPVMNMLDHGSLGRSVDEIALSFFADDIRTTPVFREVRERMNANSEEVMRRFSKPGEPIWPVDYEGDDTPYQYLRGTPLLKLFDAVVPYVIPDRTRFEHHHIIAGTGHGKTQTLQYMIARDLETVARGEASIIVLDSQRQMIPTITRLKCFAPGGSLAGKLVLVDPTDVKFPVALPLFQTKPQSDPAEAERLHNASIELLSYIFKGLLGADLTPYQSTLLGFSLRACMAIPGATIHTLREVLEDVTPYAEHLRKLDPLARRFFDTQYDERRYQQSRAEVTSKLFGIFNNTAFTRMFSSPEAKLDLFTEMNAGKVILIDTASNHMQSAASLFGRLFISLVLQATHERLNRAKLPTYFYIDEAYQYFDSNVGTLLEQARKSNVGMILAHQGLYQLEELQHNLLANTSIRFAGGVPADAKALAGVMSTTAEFIQSLPKLTFAAHVRGQPTVPITIPAGHMENMERMDADEWGQVQEDMRVRYTYQPAAEHEEVEADEPAAREDATPSAQAAERKVKDETAPTDW